MDQGTRKFLESKFNAIDEKFEKNTQYVDQKFEENKRYVDQKFQENTRYFGLVAEGLRTEIQQVAEGHQILLDGQSRITDRLDRMERDWVR